MLGDHWYANALDVVNPLSTPHDVMDLYASYGDYQHNQLVNEFLYGDLEPLPFDAPGRFPGKGCAD